VSARVRQLQETIALLSREVFLELLRVEAPEPPYLTIPAFAARLSLSERTVRRMIEDGMPVERPRKRAPRIKVVDADRWIAKAGEREQGEATPAPGAVHNG
jgi:hypothetical protein